VLNKIDLVDGVGRERLDALYPQAVRISARTSEGLEQLRDSIADFFARSLRPVTLLVPYSEAGLLHRLRGVGSDMVEENTADGVLLSAYLPEAEARRYAAYAVDGSGDDGKEATDNGDEEAGERDDE
jgi:GTP-binding protein HflX